jgi:predicted XRE-type DNA-binding protein
VTIRHVTPVGANLFADLGIEPVEAENLYVRAELMYAIVDIVRSRGLKQKDAGKLFGVSQPRISDLTRGEIDAFTIDSLVNMLAHAGMRVKVAVVDAANEPATYAVEPAVEESVVEEPAIEAPSAAQA